MKYLIRMLLIRFLFSLIDSFSLVSGTEFIDENYCKYARISHEAKLKLRNKF